MNGISGFCDSMGDAPVASCDKLVGGNSSGHRLFNSCRFDASHHFKVNIKEGDFSAVGDQEALGLFTRFVSNTPFNIHSPAFAAINTISDSF